MAQGRVTLTGVNQPLLVLSQYNSRRKLLQKETSVKVTCLDFDIHSLFSIRICLILFFVFIFQQIC